MIESILSLIGWQGIVIIVQFLGVMFGTAMTFIKITTWVKLKLDVINDKHIDLVNKVKQVELNSNISVDKIRSEINGRLLDGGVPIYEPSKSCTDLRQECMKQQDRIWSDYQRYMGLKIESLEKQVQSFQKSYDILADSVTEIAKDLSDMSDPLTEAKLKQIFLEAIEDVKNS